LAAETSVLGDPVCTILFGYGRTKFMNLQLLKPGHKIGLRGGAVAEVLSETEDGDWIKVQYLNDQDDPIPVGAEDITIHRDEVEVLLGVTHNKTWGDRVAVVVHHVPESEANESGYEAVTMLGVPHGISITAGDPDSAEAALERLLDGLRAFGFSGWVAVEDATTYVGDIRRYELRLD
jgi:hypothetical protein